MGEKLTLHIFLFRLFPNRHFYDSGHTPHPLPNPTDNGYMAKDPAFLFYPADFIIGTQFFTDEQTGQYIRLLLAQHQHGHLTENHMKMICKTLDKDVMQKFEQDENGNYFNVRMDMEKNKRANYSASRSANKKGKTKSYDNDMINICESHDNHMVNENVNNNLVDNNKKEKPKNQFPRLDYLIELPALEIGKIKELIHIIKKVELTDLQIEAQFKAFKIQNFTGLKFYENDSDIFQHFQNWIKLQNFTNGNKQSVSDKAATGIELAKAALAKSLNKIATSRGFNNSEEVCSTANAKPYT